MNYPEFSRRGLMAAVAGAAMTLAAGGLNAQTLTPVTFVQPSPSAINSFNVFVAIGEGYFAEEGLEVTVEAINGSGPVLQALSAGQAQFGRPGPGPVLAARARDVDVVFIYNVAARSNFGIVVEQDSELQAPADLKGKVVGTGTADGAEVGFARNVLSGAGLTEGTDYTFLTVGDGGPATAAFQRGDIIAYSASTADAAILNQRGVAVRDITPEEYARFFGNGLVTTGELDPREPRAGREVRARHHKGHVLRWTTPTATRCWRIWRGQPAGKRRPGLCRSAVRRGAVKTVPVDMPRRASASSRPRSGKNGRTRRSPAARWPAR
jgi:NitT/TauT family transport system substrate-binding protein